MPRRPEPSKTQQPQALTTAPWTRLHLPVVATDRRGNRSGADLEQEVPTVVALVLEQLAAGIQRLAASERRIRALEKEATLWQTAFNDLAKRTKALERRTADRVQTQHVLRDDDDNIVGTVVIDGDVQPSERAGILARAKRAVNGSR